MRIAVAGFQHETNTFAPLQADLDAFVRDKAWPGLATGEAVIEQFGAMNLPVAGFMQAANEAGHDTVPILWCAAEPSSYVTAHAYQSVMELLLDGLRQAKPFDAVYLDLHGAMVTELDQDGEGAILAAVRDVIGDGLPLVMSLDLHANVTARMVALTDAITIYRTYPHLDMAATGARCLTLLARIAEHGKPHKAFAQIPFLVPLQAQYTRMAPADRLYAMLDTLPQTSAWSADIAAGFPPADIHDAGPSVVTYASDEVDAEQMLQTLVSAFVNAEAEFDTSTWTPAQAVRRAMQQPTGKPVVLADIEDNSGAGATSDTTGMLHALVAGQAQGAALAMVYDPGVAAIAHQRGVGGRFHAELGGKLGGPGNDSFAAEFEVVALSNGDFDFTGQMMAGAKAHLGPMALLRILITGCDIRVVVGSERCQCLDQAIFRHLGVDLDATRVIVVKSTVHFRADFEPLAQTVWAVRAPGANPCELTEVSYKHLRPGVRLGPSGPTHG